jgi:cytoskeletal protein CcmA (bactofilin family)
VIWRRDDSDRAADGLPAAPDHAPSDEHGETTTEKVPVRTEVRGMADQGGQGGEVTIVGQGAKLEGTVVSAGSLRIDGQVKGQINAEGDVLLSPQSQVEADIRAQNVVVAGRFKGTITVKGRAELARGGRVDGDITSKTLVVEDGGIFQGQSIMDQQPAQAPPQKAAAPAKGATAEAEEAKV